MKVLIVNSMTPFVTTDADMLAIHLQKNLRLAGHEAEILRIPFQAKPITCIPSQMLMVRAFELSNVDHVIALAFPALLIRHPRKVLWLLHQHQQMDGLFDASQNAAPDDGIRLLIKNAEHESFAESRHIYTNSETIHQRVQADHGINTRILQSPRIDTNIPVKKTAGNDLDTDDWQQTIEVLLQ